MKNISFDYDGTLDDHFDGQKNPRKEKIQKLLKQLSEDDNYNVYVITRRFGPEHSEEGLTNEHEKVYELLNNLNIVLPEENVIFINRKYKYSFINELNIDIHLDDDFKELDLIGNYSSGTAVNVNKKDWKTDIVSEFYTQSQT